MPAKEDKNSALSPSSDESEGGGGNGGSAAKGQLVDKAAQYRDFSMDIPDRMEKEGAQNFPMKLHMILSNPEFQDVIAWLPHGRAWRILQHKAFEERVIPLYFRHGRYSSFARQVNGWSFKRITCGPDYNSYYHELFLREKPHLCRKMKRLASKDAKKLEAQNDVDAPVPDFYAISREFPLPELQGFRHQQDLLPSSAGDAAPASAGFRLMDAKSKEQEIAMLERRRQEIIQRMTALQGGPPNDDPNSTLLMFLGKQQQQQQQQQPLPPYLASTLAALTGGGVQGAALAGNHFAFANFGRPGQPAPVPSVTAPGGFNIAQLLSQYQAGAPTANAPCGVSGAPVQSLNIAELLSQKTQPENSGTAATQGSPGLPNLSALFGANTGSATAGGASSNPNQLLMQQLLSAPSPSDALAALQRQLAGGSTFLAPMAASPPPPAPTPPSTPSATDAAALQKKILEAAAVSNGAITPEVLTLLQKQLGFNMGSPATFSTANDAFAAQSPPTSVPSPSMALAAAQAGFPATTASGSTATAAATAVGPDNIIMSLFGVPPGSPAAVAAPQPPPPPASPAPQAAAAPPAIPSQDELQRQILAAAVAGSSNPNAILAELHRRLIAGGAAAAPLDTLTSSSNTVSNNNAGVGSCAD